eukprot:6205123-Pleurochrysis_carterae.AAC.1
MNEVLVRYHCLFRFKEKKGDRDRKPAGNECRKLLWTPGILLELLQVRWNSGRTETAMIATSAESATSSNNSGKPQQLQQEQAAAAAVGVLQQAGRQAGLGADTERRTAQAQAAASKRRPPSTSARPSISIPAGGFTMPAQVSSADPAASNSNILHSGACTSTSTTAGGAPSSAAQPTNTPHATIPDSDFDDDDCDAEQLRGDEQEILPEMPANSVVGNYTTALKAVLALLELHMELGKKWDDDSAETRSQKATAASEKGRAWATAVRTHCGDSVGHYYMHVAFAHLDELLLRHGHLQHGNDEVFEKGNRDVKQFKAMAYTGGSSAANKQKQVQKRRRKISGPDNSESEYEEFEVERDNNVGPIEYVAMLQAGKEIVESRYLHVQTMLQETSSARRLAKQAKREKDEYVKGRSVLSLKHDDTALPPSD